MRCKTAVRCGCAKFQCGIRTSFQCELLRKISVQNTTQIPLECGHTNMCELGDCGSFCIQSMCSIISAVQKRSLEEQLREVEPNWLRETRLVMKNEGCHKVNCERVNSFEELQTAAADEEKTMSYLYGLLTNTKSEDSVPHKNGIVNGSTFHTLSKSSSMGSLSSWPIIRTSMDTQESKGITTSGNSSNSLEAQNHLSESDELTYQVQFGNHHKDCKLCTKYNLDFTPDCGSFVMIQSGEKDGLDMGIVTAVYNPAQYKHKMRSIGMSRDTEENKIGTILRLAMPSERLKLPEKVQKEAEIFSNVFHLVHRVFKLPLELKGVELQFDLRKLTVFYHSDSRVDFRELVRDLNLIYRVRIWMKKTNFCRPFEPNSQAAISLRTGI